MNQQSPGWPETSARLPSDEEITRLMRSVARKQGDPAERVLRSGMHNALLVAGAAILGLCLWWVSSFFVLRWDAQILGSELVCQEPLHNRCAHLFTVRMDGRTLTRYDVPNGFTSVDLTVGNVIHKERFGFGYRVNAERKTWWPQAFYVAKIWLIGAALVGLWVLHRLRSILVYRRKFRQGPSS